MKVKVFAKVISPSKPGADELEKEINSWLAETNADVINISLSTSGPNAPSVVCIIQYNDAQDS